MKLNGLTVPIGAVVTVALAAFGAVSAFASMKTSVANQAAQVAEMRSNFSGELAKLNTDREEHDRRLQRMEDKMSDVVDGLDRVEARLMGMPPIPPSGRRYEFRGPP